MKKLNVKNLKKILIHKKNEYKYLSPHIFRNKNNFILAYCNRKSKKKLIWNISFKKFSYNEFEEIVGSKKF